MIAFGKPSASSMSSPPVPAWSAKSPICLNRLCTSNELRSSKDGPSAQRHRRTNSISCRPGASSSNLRKAAFSQASCLVVARAWWSKRSHKTLSRSTPFTPVSGKSSTSLNKSWISLGDKCCSSTGLRHVSGNSRTHVVSNRPLEPIIAWTIFVLGIRYAPSGYDPRATLMLSNPPSRSRCNAPNSAVRQCARWGL